MDIRIEKVLPSDDNAVSFIASEYLKMFLEINPELIKYYANNISSTNTFIADYIDKNIASDTIIYIAYLNEELIGALQFDRDNHLSGLFVKEEFRNNKIGSKLLERLITDCYSNGVITVDARVSTISFYERFSFKKTNGTNNKFFIPMELDTKRR